MEQTFTVLRREQLLIDHAPHSVQFQDLTDSLLRVCSAAAVIPALSALEIRLYSTLALLHDVGKRAIPQEILNKPGSLTQEEFSIMKSHTTQGCDLLEKIPELRECEAFPLICDVSATTTSVGTAAATRTNWPETASRPGYRWWGWRTHLTLWYIRGSISLRSPSSKRRR